MDFSKQIAIYTVLVQSQVAKMGKFSAKAALGIIWSAVKQASIEVVTANATGAEKKAFVVQVGIVTMNAIIGTIPMPFLISKLVAHWEPSIDAVIADGMDAFAEFVYTDVVAPTIVSPAPTPVVVTPPPAPLPVAAPVVAPVSQVIPVVAPVVAVVAPAAVSPPSPVVAGAKP